MMSQGLQRFFKGKYVADAQWYNSKHAENPQQHPDWYFGRWYKVDVLGKTCHDSDYSNRPIKPIACNPRVMRYLLIGVAYQEGIQDTGCNQP
ncbi:hypothetical protein ZMTM_07520 [Methyloradius palustris]|uniref:Uncharacterized protein n=1 Tax=Methyloradius palustris TaxID=2778876 RepID=A0A8D5K084_9PROT|nr:hypothetical protein ZMTM_07520 [Methyloradius palustris]